MKQRIDTIIKTLEEQKALMLVSILASSGSTPRGAGAMMLVFEDGHAEGTIGGGAVEFAAQKHAQELLKTKTSDTVGYSLKKDDVANLGMICGGDVKVYFQYLKGEEALPLFYRLQKACDTHEDSWLIRRFEGHKVTAMAVYDKEGLSFGDDIEEDDFEEDDYEEDVETIHLMGFDGKSIINPRQISIVHEIFTPSQKDIIFAEKVVREIDTKKAQGIGVFTVDGKMIDIAFYDGAKRTIELAKASGVYKGDL